MNTRLAFLALAVAVAATSVACERSATAPTPVASGAVPAAAGAEAKAPRPLYFLSFSGDITSGSLGPVALNSADPWRGISLKGVTLTLPNTVDLAGCSDDGSSWRSNAGDWTGDLVIQDRGNFTHLGFLSAGGALLNLAVNHDADSSKSGTSFLLTFTNAKALVGLGSPDPAADPCVTLTITAKPQ